MQKAKKGTQHVFLLATPCKLQAVTLLRVQALVAMLTFERVHALLADD